MTVGRGDQELLRPYMPRLVVEWLRATPELTWREVEGSLAFVDISGFTKLTERLARKGRIGAEEMSDTLSATFSALLAAAYQDGAGLVKWGGDAVLLLFQGDEHAARAARASYRMRRRLRERGALETSAGRVSLRMSVGIHSGAFHFFLVGDPARHRELLVSGPAASVTARVEGEAKAGQVGLSPATAALLPTRLVRRASESMYLLTGEPAAVRYPAPPLPDTAGLDLGGTLSAPIRAHLLGGGGEPEHRQIAVAFVQFSGTDDLLFRQGPAALAAALDQCMRTVQEATERHGVTFFETDINADGGKVMLVAGAPTSAGSNEERLLLAARHILDRPGVLPVRIGLNSGGVFTGDFGPPFRRTYSVKGDAINLAARVMGKAAPGQLLATAGALGRSRTTFDTSWLAPFMVKGKARPVEAADVGSAVTGPSGPQVEAPLVGRDAELAVLTGALESARARRGTLVELVGEPGIGKSRLADELRTTAADLTVVAVTCDEYESSTAYFPFRSLLRDVAGIPEGAAPSDVLRRLTDRVLPNDPQLVPWLPLVGVALDLELPATDATRALGEQFRKTRLEETVARFLAATLPTSTLLLVDDVHLMDDASADMFGRVVAGIAERPWLMLVTRRDRDEGFVPARTGTPVVSVRPAPLDESSALSLAGVGDDDVPLPPHQLAAITARAGGNPLFLRSLLTAARAGQVGELPESVEGVITSQIDRLPTAERALLRFAAVLGVTFAEGDLRQVLGDAQLPQNRASVARLGEFLEPAGHGRFRFRHALIRDAAYEGLSYRRRQELHGRVGDMLESDRHADQDAELLSLHFFHAGRHDKAWHYSRTAGDRAGGKYAYVEAVEFYDRALGSARRADAAGADMAHVHESLGDALFRVGEYERAQTAFRAARRLLPDDPPRTTAILLKESLIAQRQGKVVQTMRILSRGLGLLDGRGDPASMAQRSMLESSYAWCRVRQGRYGDALRWGRRAEEHGLAADDSGAVAEAYTTLQQVATWSAFAKDRDYGRLALDLYVELDDRLQQANVVNNLALAAFFAGRWTEAHETWERARSEYDAAGDTLGAALATYNQGDVVLRQGRLADAEQLLRSVRAVSAGLGEPELTAAAGRELGRARVLRGATEEGRRLLETARETFGEMGAAYEVLVADAGLVECLLLEGDLDGAAGLAKEALDRAVALDAVTVLPTLRRLTGLVMLAQGRVGDASTELEAALASSTEHAAHERGFILLALANAYEALGDPRAPALRTEASAVLDALGVVATPPERPGQWLWPSTSP